MPCVDGACRGPSVCQGASCPLCRGRSWMHSAQPPGQPWPEDVRALCVSSTSLCSCCVQVPQSPRALCLRRGHRAALSQQPRSSPASAGRPGQGQAPCQPHQPVPCSVWVRPPAQLCPGHRVKPAPYPTGLILLGQAETVGIGAGRGVSTRPPPLLGVQSGGCWASSSLTGRVVCAMPLPCQQLPTGTAPCRGVLPWSRCHTTVCFTRSKEQRSGPSAVEWDGEQTPHVHLGVLGWDSGELRPVPRTAPACPSSLAPGLFGERCCGEVQQWFRDRVCPQALGEGLAGPLEDAAVVGTGGAV